MGKKNKQKDVVKQDKDLKQELQNNLALEQSSIEFENIVLKGYLDNLNQYEVMPLDTSLEEAIGFIRLKKVSRIVYDKEEDNLDKFNNVFSALHSCNTSLSVILKGSKKYTDVYIGTNQPNSDDAGYGAEVTLEGSLKGSFPGIEFKSVYDDEIEDLLKSINNDDNNFISNVTGVPSLKDEDKQNKFVQGLEKIIEGMQNKNYTAVIQGTPVARQELERMESAYQEIYSTLSVFEQNQMTLSEQESIALGKSLTEGLTETVNNSIAKSQSTTDSIAHTEGSTKSISYGRAAGVNIGPLSSSISITGSYSKTESETKTQSETKGVTLTKSLSKARNKSVTDNKTLTNGTSKSLQVTEKNRGVQSLLEIIDEQLKRIQECKNYGMWSWGAYFISEDETISKLGADLYSGLLRGEKTGFERNVITIWDKYNDKNKYTKLLDYVSQLKHPVFFQESDDSNNPTVLATSLISTKEVTIAMSLPQKSLPGIPVFESVEFGRAVTTYRTEESKKKIQIGSIFNLGNIDKNIDVDLDIDSLTSHTFVTGSTGSGKSNSIYLMLNELLEKKNIPFLIIEPAKGEYKDIFGGRDDVNVFGTNPKFTPLLKINPFAFPNEIHVIEHIDRLIEILNAVWPMYAAMPAILKEAIEKAYEKMGWNLLNSQNKYEKVAYPDFQDLLNVLPKVIEKSGYSDEIKSNYAGALLTRVRSMTNGYFRTIFQKEELVLEELFEESCIVDLSRVGSSETKSLLMGMVFLKLQEYRMSKASAESANSELQHITVLEEAHNLLRRTSSEQSAEGANLQGKSVEMISNAIAEMRTYGEGFIIADQAPGLLDQSVIRNTNTKIILRLPDWDDRNLVGKAANLKEEQIEELARLRTGCAAVYQNDWQEAVLCQFDFFEKENHKKFAFTPPEGDIIDSRKLYKTELIKILLSAKLANKEPAEFAKENNIDLTKIAEYYPEIIEKIKLSQIESNIFDILSVKELLDKVEQNDDPDTWARLLYKEIIKEIEDDLLNEKLKKELLKNILDSMVNDNTNNKEFFEILKEKINNWRL